MVKIKIMKPGAAVVVDYDEMKAEEVFKDITAKLLGIDGKEKPEKACGAGPVKSPKTKENKTIPPLVKAPEIAPAQTEAEDAGSSGHKNSDAHSGFLYIKCAHCGAERAYCQKAPSEYSICKRCGSRTYFTEPLKQILVSCECGQRSRYLTNMTDDMFDIQCIDCGSPVAVKYNQKTKCYETIR